MIAYAGAEEVVDVMEVNELTNVLLTLLGTEGGVQTGDDVLVFSIQLAEEERMGPARPSIALSERRCDVDVTGRVPTIVVLAVHVRELGTCEEGDLVRVLLPEIQDHLPDESLQLGPVRSVPDHCIGYDAVYCELGRLLVLERVHREVVFLQSRQQPLKLVILDTLDDLRKRTVGRIGLPWSNRIAVTDLPDRPGSGHGSRSR